jgi:hypothetical protein
MTDAKAEKKLRDYKRQGKRKTIELMFRVWDEWYHMMTFAEAFEQVLDLSDSHKDEDMRKAMKFVLDLAEKEKARKRRTAETKTIDLEEAKAIKKKFTSDFPGLDKYFNRGVLPQAQEILDERDLTDTYADTLATEQPHDKGME